LKLINWPLLWLVGGV